MRRFSYILTFISLLGVSCQNRTTCSLTGTLSNCKDSTVIYIMDYDLPDLEDSIIVVNGTFHHKLRLTHPTRFFLHNKRNQNEFRDQKTFWLDPSEISLSGNFEFLENLKVNGSVSNLESEKYQQLLKKANKKINKLEEEIRFKSEGEKVNEQIRIDSLRKELSNEIVQFLIDYKNSYVALFELHSECYTAFRHLNKEQIKKVYSNLSNEFKGTVMGTEVKKYIELPEPPKIGDLAPEIIQVTPSGDTIRLSDFRGKYVLIDFWASWCGPCRSKFPSLRKKYAKYSPYGLEILGVSGDNNKNDWVGAIKQDSISWVNISDLKGWQNEAFLLYDIKRIPSFFLINPDGFIIKANNDRSVSVTDQVLSDIFIKKNGL